MGHYIADGMTLAMMNQVTAGLLMLMLSFVLGMVIILSVFVVGYLKRVRADTLREANASNSNSEPESNKFSHPLAFGTFNRWIAIRTTNATAVQTALGLHNAISCSWVEGIFHLNEHNLFISPPIQGWVLVLGQGLPDPAEDIDQCFCFIVKLSRAIGQVQFFSANRAVNHHAWVQADNGKIRRGYAWAGETLWNQGSVTPAEKELGMKCFAYGEGSESFGLSTKDSFHANSEKIGFLAARWSLDPTMIDETALSSGHGIAGDLTHSRPN